MDLPEHLHGFAQQAVIAEQNAAFSRQEAAERAKRWAVVLGLVPQIDGNMWGIVWGEFPTGVAAFGETPELAIDNFDKAMAERIVRPSSSPSSPNQEQRS